MQADGTGTAFLSNNNKSGSPKISGFKSAENKEEPVIISSCHDEEVSQSTVLSLLITNCAKKLEATNEITEYCKLQTFRWTLSK